MILAKALDLFYAMNRTPLFIFKTDGCDLPSHLLDQPQLMLKLTVDAIQGQLLIDNEGLSCTMRFNMVAHSVFVPTSSMLALKSQENDMLIPLTNQMNVSVIQQESKKELKLTVVAGGNLGGGAPSASLTRIK
jgi:stringent starvation protein B